MKFQVLDIIWRTFEKLFSFFFLLPIVLYTKTAWLQSSENNFFSPNIFLSLKDENTSKVIPLVHINKQRLFDLDNDAMPSMSPMYVNTHTRQLYAVINTDLYRTLLSELKRKSF